VQKAHPTLEAAHAAYRPGVCGRVMQITVRGRGARFPIRPNTCGSYTYLPFRSTTSRAVDQ